MKTLAISRAQTHSHSTIHVDNPDFESLIQQHYPRILRAAVLLVGNSWDADELAQETFLQAMQSWHRFAGQSKVETWLYSILLNVRRKRLRSAERGWRRWLAWFHLSKGAVPEKSPADVIELEEWRENLWSCVESLPEAQRIAVVLRYSEGLTYDQIAEVMGCPAGTVKSRLHHGLAALKSKLRKDQRKSKHQVQVAAVHEPIVTNEKAATDEKSRHE